MRLQRCLVALLALTMVSPLAAAESFNVTLKVVDADKKPVAKASAALFWDAKDGVMNPAAGRPIISTDAAGKGVLPVDNWNEKRAVMVLSEDRKLGGIVSVSKDDEGKEISVTLQPTIRVKGKLNCTEQMIRPERANTIVIVDGFGGYITQYLTKEGEFQFVLPPGTYTFNSYGSDVERVKTKVTLTSDRPEHDFGTIDMKASAIARLKGKPAPDLEITDARGVKADVKLADYKGKWVYLEFWAYWCGPCCAGSLPELIALYEDHAEHRDKFEVFAIHGKTVTSFVELDGKLPNIKEGYWRGKNLPFPVLLDTTNNTHQKYGIEQLPTGVLIDPDGNLVGLAAAADLEAKLPPIPLARKWARHRDIQKNFFYSFEPTKTTLKTLADALKVETSCEFDLDLEAIKTSGLTPDGPLPGVLIGVNVTLRSIDELLLAPHGLGVAPSADGKKLLITRRAPGKEAESWYQKMHARKLNERLDHGPAGAKTNEAKPLAIKNLPLLDATKKIAHEFDLPMALDAKGMQAKTLDPSARVTGTIDPNNLRGSLTTTLEPLGLVVEVRQEVLLITPKGR